jgi:hypothetical protein
MAPVINGMVRVVFSLAVISLLIMATTLGAASLATSLVPLAITCGIYLMLKIGLL